MSVIKGVLIDLSGTIHIDAKVIPGAVEAIQRLKKSQIPLRLEQSYLITRILN